MRKLLLVIIVFLIQINFVYADVYVKSYIRKDGTRVRAHWRSDPDGIIENNWSYGGYSRNINTKSRNLEQGNGGVFPSATYINSSFKKSPLSQKCITEDYDLKICDLYYNTSYYNDEIRIVRFDEKDVICSRFPGATSFARNVIPNIISLDYNLSFCVSDYGDIYIDPALFVEKFYGKIKSKDNFYLERKYDVCVWTYTNGNAGISYIEILDQNGPATGFNFKVFCTNKNSNTISIYTDR
jgi:hypothetical protein